MGEGVRAASELMGLPVFSVHEGQKLGAISVLLINREGRVLEAVGVGGGPFRQPRYVRLSQISTIGRDAVMIPSAAVLSEPLSAQETRALDGNLSGRPVMTESGQRVGEITGFRVHTATGKIESYHIRPEGQSWLTSLVKSAAVEIPDSLVVSLGENALIVRDEALTLVKPEGREATPPGALAAEGSPSDARARFDGGRFPAESARAGVTPPARGPVAVDEKEQAANPGKDASGPEAPTATDVAPKASSDEAPV